MPNRAAEEIENGRLWRAKEILRGRLADAGYDAALFAELADVLARMHDDDEAGCFYLLAGETRGRGGDLARAFLARRKARAFPQVWSEMPAAARRASADMLPGATLDMLREAGFEPLRVKAHLSKLTTRRKDRRAIRKRRLVDAAIAARGERIGLAVAAILLVILTVGLVGTLRLVWWGLGWIFGFA